MDHDKLNPIPKTFWHRLTRERLLWTALLAAALILVARPWMTDGIVRGMPADRFWAMKAAWKGVADVVLAGDSRVYIGVSPAELTRQLGSYRVVNFGFSGNGYGSAYLYAVESVLDAHSTRKTIILGITPSSLTVRSVQRNGFHEARKQWADPSARVALCFADLLRFTEPVPLLGVVYAFLPGRHLARYDTEFCSDGWEAVVRVPEEKALFYEYCRDTFRNNPVSPDITYALLQQVTRWRQQGIDVYGFVPPIELELAQVEKQASGFDESAFAHAFESAGGVWIPSASQPYRTYDGHHLPRTVALQFSANLARQLNALAQRRQQNTPQIAGPFTLAHDALPQTN